MEKKQGIGFFEKIPDYLGSLVYRYRDGHRTISSGNTANIEQI